MFNLTSDFSRQYWLCLIMILVPFMTTMG